MIVGSNILAGASGQQGYFLNRSVRFRSSAQAYFSRTPAASGNTQIFTWNFWVKRGQLSAYQDMYFTNAGGGTFASISWTANNTLTITSVNASVAQCELITSAVYRDCSAWYMLTFAVDTTQATASNRVKVYVNGVQVTAFATATYPAQNYNFQMNNTLVQNIGRPATYPSDFYMAEVNFIDGQALTPTSFGAFNVLTGIWQPIKYSGTYGTQGYYLNFNDNSAATAAAIGKDSSGNGNNWTPNNISVTAGATYDSMTDVPTLTSPTTANYCVINPLDVQNASSVAQGNQYISFSAVNYGHSRATQAIPDGSYWEVVAGGTNWLMLGVANSTAYSSFNWAGSWAIYQADGKVYNNGAAITGVLATFTTNDVIGFALKGNKLYIAKNGTWLNSGDPVAQTGFVASGISSEVFPYIGNGGGSAGTPSAYFNGGQRPFTYTPPTGFVALNTYNLPTPTIANGANQFAATTYTGNGGSGQVVTNTVNGNSFQPDFVWIKSRSNIDNNQLVDSVRGLSGTPGLSSNSTNAEFATGIVTAFNSNGFTSSTGTTQNYIGWQWKSSNATAVTNTAGSITSTVSANPTAGFSIVTFTAQASGTATVGHGLGVAPAMIITKARAAVSYWNIYHQSLGNTKYIQLESTAAATTASGRWNNTSPTSSVFTMGVDFGGIGTMVAYCFSEIAGYSKFGSYTGNGSTDGTFVYTGFRPRFILLKNSSSAADWVTFDTSRDTYNLATKYLVPNTSGAEATGASVQLDILSNGFKIRGTWVGMNASGNTIIYAAFCESPFNYSLAR